MAKSIKISGPKKSGGCSGCSKKVKSVAAARAIRKSKKR